MTLKHDLKVPMTRNSFFAQILSLSYVQANSDRRKISKNLKLGFFGPSSALFCLKSVPWIGNELAGDDVENCENSQLTLKNLSHL